MSGVTGDNRIQSRNDFEVILSDIKNKLSHFTGFVSVKPTGSYNSDQNKQSFGDMDLITLIDGSIYNNYKKQIKAELAKFLVDLGESITTPFKSEKYLGKRFHNSGEIVSVSWKVENNNIDSVQIDFIIAVDQNEATFKKQFLDMPAEKQGLVLGLTKTVLLERDVDELFTLLSINHKLSDLLPNQEYCFNLSSKELQLRKVTYEAGTYTEIDRFVLWTSTNFEELGVVLSEYDLSMTFKDMLYDIKSKLKNPRSAKRILGVFNSMISIKSGEVGKEKGYHKQKAIDMVQSVLGENAKSTVAFAFGRFNPPTIGHVLLIDKVKEANPSDYRVYLSHTVDKKKNPLTYNQKIEFITSIAPHHSDHIIQSQSKTIFNIMVELYNDGYKDVVLVVGSDRVDEFTESLNKYNGVKSKHGLYSFDNIIVKSAGVRDPDSDGVEGISASKMRQAVLNDDVETFKLGLPPDYDHTPLWNA